MEIRGPNNELLAKGGKLQFDEDETTMQLQSIEIESFMGIETLKFEVGPGGALIVGKSRSGKSRILEAVYAALKSRGYGPEYITDGADRWRVLMKFDQATVQTTVRRSGSKDVKVDGLGLGSPQAKLDAVFPDLIDPWRLALDKPEERRRKVLAAMPAVVTAEDLKRWTGEDMPAPDSEKHGLDVVRELHDRYYQERTTANKSVKDAEAAYKLAQDEAERLAKPEHKGVAVSLQGQEDEPVRAAEKAREALEQQRQQAEAMARRTEGTRARVAKLREDAEARARRIVGPVAFDDRQYQEDEVKTATEEVARLKRELQEAEARLETARIALRRVYEVDEVAKREQQAVDEMRLQAADLEATLAETAIEPPTADELAQADAAVVEAHAHRELVRSARAAHDALARATALGALVDDAKEEADRLNVIVKRLDNEAPAELAARANIIPGLSFGDDIKLDGHEFKLLSESERIELCVDLVKRIAPDSKLLRIDRMEAMDPDLRETFIRKAQAGGWQILGTVVERGEMRIVAIEADQDQAGAAA